MNTIRVCIIVSTGVLVCAVALLPRLARLFSRSLRIGDRIRLRGGHEEPPLWLRGRPDVYGRVTAVIPYHDTDAVEVALDEPLAQNGVSYGFALLRLRFKDAKWSQHEVVRVELWADAPSRFALDGVSVPHEYVESHASYQVIRLR